MAAGHQPSPAPVEPARVEAWLKALQQALQVEADRGFGDLKGRQCCFSVFVVQQLLETPAELPAAALERVLELRSGFEGYGALSLARRQSLVRQCRERLHALRQAQRPVLAVAPPRLRLVQPGAETASPTGNLQFDADTPLAEIRGVGPKTASRLAQLGLLLVRDLVHYYPRDYLDYANLVRICGLEPGLRGRFRAQGSDLGRFGASAAGWKQAHLRGGWRRERGGCFRQKHRARTLASPVG